MKKTPEIERLTGEDLHELFELMSHPMISFDCGKLCRDSGGGIPVCCNHDEFHPLLFTDELLWLNEHKQAAWTRFKPSTRQEREMTKDVCDHVTFADCPGASNCNRHTRALVCRFFPFEPHLDSSGKLLGLAFITDDASKCPLVAHPEETFSKDYIQASLKAWQRIIDTFQPEKKLYISESAKRERAAHKQGRKVSLLN